MLKFPPAIIALAMVLPAFGRDSVVVFNEAHYHPAGDNSNLEYVELYNQLAANVDLSNWRLDGDIRFDFPEGTVIGGRGYLVVARNPAALAVATGFAGALGPYDGSLSNSGSPVVLYNNNLAFRTSPQTSPGVPASKLWSVDLQGDGAGGAFGQLAPPLTMSGTEGNSGLGNYWNAFVLPGHNGTVTDPSMALADSAGAASSVTFSITGRVTGWSQGGSALVSDYLFVNAGNSAASIGWKISGLTPGETYAIFPYGGISRDILLTIDKDADGDLSDETGVIAASAGILIEDITADAAGEITGRAERGSVTEGNWSGFQIFEQTSAAPPPVGTPTSSLDRRRIMDQLDYRDTDPWPVGPDGSGFTLAKRLPNTGTARPENWTTSGQLNGTPGAANTFPPLPTVAFNEIAATTDAGFRVELHNFGGAPVALGGMVVASTNPLHPEFTLAPGSLAAGAFITLDAATLGFTPEDNNRLLLLTSGKIALIDAVRADDRPVARHPDGTGRWLRPGAPTFGAANAVSLQEAIVINEIFYHAYPQRASPGSPPGLVDSLVLDYGSEWRYNLNAGAAGLPSGWAGEAHAVDGTAWAQGPGLLGADSAAPAEPIRTNLALSLKVPYYFETEFSHTGSNSVAEMVIEHFVDDGAVFYLNGAEIGRFNMPAGPILPGTLANPGVSDATRNTLTVPAPNVLPGSNRLSVEVHQSSAGSSDLVWGARVTLRVSDGTGVPAVPFAERDEEWLELYNRSTSAVDLTGWKLAGGIDYAFPPGTSLPAGAYLVVARDAAALAAKHPAAPVLGDYSGRLANGGEWIRLEDAVGNPADEVRYFDSGKWHAAADGGGSSLELRDPDSDNAIAGAWAASDETTRSAWQTYTYEGVAINDGIGHNVFHEFLIGLLDAGEFLLDDVSVVENNTTEFIQNGDFQGDAIGANPARWRTLGTHGSHGRSVVVADPDAPGNRCLHVVTTGPTEDKHNKLETTYANSEQVVPGNSYRIRFRAKWLHGSNQVNSRLYFNYLQRSTHLDVPDIWGTPGSANSVAVANAGPTLGELAHSPVVPNAGQPVVVSLAASDPDGISDLLVFYSVNGGGFQSSALTNVSGARFSGTIPGQAAGAIVRFYVRGRDSTNTPSLYPAGGQRGGAFYKVQDGFADNSGARHNFRVVMAESDRSFLFASTNRMSNDNFPVTVIEDETTVYYDVGLRLKASAFGRYNSGHYGFNIEFQPDQLFRGVHGSISVERSPNLKEILAKHLMNRAGDGYWSFYDDVAHVITPTAGDRGVGLLSMARHTGTFFEGLFPEAEDPGTLFNHELLYNPNGTSGGPEGLKIGNPYNHTAGMYDLRDRGDDKEPYRWGFQIRSARGRDDYSQLIALNRAMNLSGTPLKEALDSLIDVDQWMRTFAMMSLNGTDDVYSRLYEHNFRYFVRPTDGKIIVFQWDLDRSFQLGTTDSVPPVRNSVAKLFAIPQYRRLFDGHLDDLIQTTFNSTYTTPWASHFTALTGSGLTGLPGYIQSRAGFAQGTLPASVSFRITSNGGSDFSLADSVANIDGDAWIDVFSIEVNGIPANVTWLDGDTWRLAVPLSIGPNALTLVAYNNRGTEVGRDTITVTNTSAIDLANAGNTLVSELHYHPSDPTPAEIAAGFAHADLFEFIELTNTGATPVSFAGVRFTDGITYDFPDDSILAAGSRLLVVSDQAAFAFRYGAGGVVGQYSGNLRNSGERLRLEAADATPIADFTFGDAHPWPESADGGGYSLVLAGTDPDNPLDWRPSTQPGGNPGSSDAIPFGGGVGDLIPYALAATPLPGFAADTFTLTFRQNLAADDAVATAEFSTDMQVWTPATVLERLSAVNEGDGTATITYRSPLPLVSDSRQFGRVRVDLR